MESTNGNSHTADDDLAEALDAFNGAGHDEDVLYGYDPQVVYDDETGDVRIIVVVPLDDGSEQPIHIPLDNAGMVAVVNGLAEARGVQPRTAAPVRIAQRDEHEAPGRGERSGLRRMVDPAGLSGLTPDDLPETILGVSTPRMMVYILALVLLVSFMLMILI